MANPETSPHTTAGDRHSSSAWLPENDETLMRARQQGMNWQPIASTYFPAKTANACRKRHERLMEKRNSAENWDNGKMEHLAKAYADVREEMWKVLAERVGEKWQVVEAKCMERGLKTLQTAGRSATRKEQSNHPNSDFDEDVTDSRYLSHRGRSRSHLDEDDGFNDSAIGPDDANHPFAQSNSRDEQVPYSATSASTPPSFFSDRRVSYSTAASSTGYTPTIAAAPQFPSQIQLSHTQQIRPSPFSPQQHHHQSHQQQHQAQILPSFSSAFGMPSISSVISRTHSPAVTTH